MSNTSLWAGQAATPRLLYHGGCFCTYTCLPTLDGAWPLVQGSISSAQSFKNQKHEAARTQRAVRAPEHPSISTARIRALRPALLTQGPRPAPPEEESSKRLSPPQKTRRRAPTKRNSQSRPRTEGAERNLDPSHSAQGRTCMISSVPISKRLVPVRCSA